jgi:hypothetical protein
MLMAEMEKEVPRGRGVSMVVWRYGGVDILSLVAIITAMAAPSSMVKPREGECRVSLFPRLRMMW